VFLPLLVMGLIAVARASTGLVAPLTGVLMRLKSLGFVGKLGYGFSLGLWTLFCLPTTPIELAAGYIFPMVPSAFISAVGKTAGNLAALVLGRRLLRPLLQRWLSRSDSSTLHEHLLRELRENPIQTMSIMRAAPLPTPFKIYGLSLFPAELVPFSTYAGIALTFNSLWSLVWSLTGSSASTLHDAMSAGGSSSIGILAGRLMLLLVLFGLFAMFSRYAKQQFVDVAHGKRHAAARSPSPVLAVPELQPAAAPTDTVSAAPEPHDRPSSTTSSSSRRASPARRTSARRVSARRASPPRRRKS